MVAGYEVRCDRRRTMERLILDDPRAVCMARFTSPLLRQPGDRRGVAPVPGLPSEVSLVDAYRALFAQWSLAFEIGAANAKQRFPP